MPGYKCVVLCITLCKVFVVLMQFPFWQARLNQQAALQIQGQNQVADGKQGQFLGQGAGGQKQSSSQNAQTTPMHSASSLQQQDQQQDIMTVARSQGMHLNVNGPLSQHVNEAGLQRQGVNGSHGLNDSWSRQPPDQSQLLHPNSNPNMTGYQARHGGEQTLNVVNGLGSGSDFPPNHYPAVSSMASPLLSPKSTHINNAHSNYGQPLSISNPGNSFLSPGISSPHLLSPHQPLLSPNTPKMGANTNGIKIPKLSLFYDPKAVPTAPSPPHPKLPLEKLKPPTPSITVSIHDFQCIST